MVIAGRLLYVFSGDVSASGNGKYNQSSGRTRRFRIIDGYYNCALVAPSRSLYVFSGDVSAGSIGKQISPAAGLAVLESSMTITIVHW